MIDTTDPIFNDRWPQAQRGVMCANRAARFAPVRGDDGHDRSFITRDFNKVWGKENGTIPF